MFCPKCKSLLLPHEGGFKCTKCGYTKTKLKRSNDTIVVDEQKEKETVVLDEQKDMLPKTRIKCPKCDNNEAYWILRQTRASDEPETRIYTCTKCGHNWREY